MFEAWLCLRMFEASFVRGFINRYNQILMSSSSSFLPHSLIDVPQMSFFSFGYPISRAYPYAWFKWVVLLGGVVALVFVTALNLAADGYVLKLQYTQRLNITTDQKRWTNHFPFNILEHRTTTCQSSEIPVNTQFWTDKMSLSYTLTRAWQDKDGVLADISTVTYTENQLNDCSVHYIKIDLTPLDIAGTQLLAPWEENTQVPGTGLLTWSPKATVRVLPNRFRNICLR